jgi:predicted GNAT family N-acyltransferase
MCKITRPSEIDPGHLFQIIELVINGGQIRRDGLQERILRADLVAYELLDDKVICTATLKNPSSTYIKKVFTLAKAAPSLHYNKELGYISTHPDFEGSGHCQNLLSEFFLRIGESPMYATTRKQAMVHILDKFGFNIAGITYNQDLILLTYDGKK